LQNPESQARYAGYMVKFVCYALRFVADAEVRMAAQEGGNECSDEDDDKGDEDGLEEEEEEENDDDFSDADGS
jgi:hypothetical protein